MRRRSRQVDLAGGTLSLQRPHPGHAVLGVKTSLQLQGSTASSGGTTTGSSSGSAWG